MISVYVWLSVLISFSIFFRQSASWLCSVFGGADLFARNFRINSIIIIWIIKWNQLNPLNHEFNKRLAALSLKFQICYFLLNIIYCQFHIRLFLLNIIYDQFHICVFLLDIIYCQFHVCLFLLSIIYCWFHICLFLFNIIYCQFKRSATYS